MKPKPNSYENWAVEHILDYWILQDEFHNKQSICLYEQLFKTYKKDKTLSKTLKEGLEMLYAERKQIAIRKTHIGSQANIRVLRWRGNGIIKQG